MARGRNPRQPQRGGFAPAFASAFASSKPSTPLSDNQEQAEYEFMRRADTTVALTWNTFDPESRSVAWTDPTQSGQQADDAALEGRGVWNKWGHAKEGEPSDDQLEVRDLFVKDQDIMKHDAGPRNDFEVRNQTALGLGRKSSGIVNMIGDKVVSTLDDAGDTRLGLIDRDGKYVDGVWRGQPKKRLLDERARRFNQKDSEIEHACAVMEEWNALSPLEQDVRRQKARRNMQTMWEVLGITEEDHMPDHYLREVPSLPIEDDELLFVESQGTLSPSIVLEDERPSQRPRRDPFVQTPRQEGLYDRTNLDSGTPRQLHRAQAPREDLRRVGPYDRARLDSDALRQHRRAQARREAQRQSIARSAATSTASTPRATPSIAPSDITYSARRTPSESRQSSAFSTAGPSVITEEGTFGVSQWPLPVPFEDLDSKLQPQVRPTGYLKEQYQALSLSCTRKPRLVVVELSTDIPKFSSEAVVARIFGGLVQEIQFYPEERIALVLFVKPADAIAFVSHAQHARRSSLHEYRRLQIAVEWHQGRADKGFVKQARYVTRLALFDRGTRVLRIDKINKRIERDDLLAILKLRLSDEGLIVQCKLVKPRHRYEEEAQYSNEVVLEFASITQAAKAKARFDKQDVKDFKLSTASYLADPICTPKPRVADCPCAHCVPLPPSNSATASRMMSIDPESSVASAGSTVGSAAPRNPGKAESINEALRLSRMGGMNYDDMADARAPDEWEDRRPWERRTHQF